MRLGVLILTASKVISFKEIFGLGAYDPNKKSEDVKAWLDAEKYNDKKEHPMLLTLREGLITTVSPTRRGGRRGRLTN